jgi:hypothetical protein
MPADIYQTLESRIPAKAKAGQIRVIRNLLEVSRQFKEAVETNHKRDDLSPKGRAVAAQKQVQATGAALRRAQRQLDHHKTTLAKGHADLVKRVVGTPKETDAEWRSMLRVLPVGERTQLAMLNPDARSAVLRAPPALSAMPDNQVRIMLDEAIRTMAPDDLSALDAAAEAQVIHEAVLRALQYDLLQVPFVIEENGNARRPQSAHELDKYIDDTVPLPHDFAQAAEQTEIDQVEAA